MPLHVPALLANFFDAGWSIQVLLGDMDQRQFLASRIARPEIERHLRVMAHSARALPAEVKAELDRVDWAAWDALEAAVGGDTPADRHAVWIALETWLPPTGARLREYRARKPALFRFSV